MDKDTNKTSANPITLKLRQTQELYVIFSACTRAPYVLCDPETFDDEVFVFFDLEKAKKAGRLLLCLGMRPPGTLFRCGEYRRIGIPH